MGPGASHPDRVRRGASPCRLKADTLVIAFVQHCIDAGPAEAEIESLVGAADSPPHPSPTELYHVMGSTSLTNAAAAELTALAARRPRAAGLASRTAIVPCDGLWTRARSGWDKFEPQPRAVWDVDVTPLRHAVPHLTSRLAPRPLEPHGHSDLLSRAGYRQTVIGVELAWVRSVNGDAANPNVMLSLDQLTLCGRYEALRERLMALVGVDSTTW